MNLCHVFAGAIIVAISFSGCTKSSSSQPADLVFVKGGCFVMGREDSPASSPHEVCVDDFYIAKYEVTQGEWQAVMGYNPSGFNRGPQFPVERVSWEECQQFLQRLSQKTGRRYRLPTEAEWEYAARDRGKKEIIAGCDNEYAAKEYAWYDGNSSDATHPVGQLKPNALGLFDMSGNVREWVQDWGEDDGQRKPGKYNPHGPEKGELKVVKGGSYASPLDSITTDGAFYNRPGERGNNIGFRLAMDAKVGGGAK